MFKFFIISGNADFKFCIVKKNTNKAKLQYTRSFKLA